MEAALVVVPPGLRGVVPWEGALCAEAYHVGGVVPVYVYCRPAWYRARRLGGRVVLDTGLPPVPLDYVAAVLAGGRWARRAVVEVERLGGRVSHGDMWVGVDYKSARIRVACGGPPLRVSYASPALPEDWQAARVPPGAVRAEALDPGDLWELAERLPPLRPPDTGVVPVVDRAELPPGEYTLPANPSTVLEASAPPALGGFTVSPAQSQPLVRVEVYELPGGGFEVAIRQEPRATRQEPLVDASTLLASAARAALRGSALLDLGPATVEAAALPRDRQGRPPRVELSGPALLGVKHLRLRLVPGLKLSIHVYNPAEAETALLRVQDGAAASPGNGSA